MEQWKAFLQIKIFVIDTHLKKLPEGLDNLEIPAQFFDHIPLHIDSLTREQECLILTSQTNICRLLVEQAIGCPIYILLENITAITIDEVFEAGATDYLSMPLRQPELLARIRQAFPEKQTSARIVQQLRTVLSYAPDAIAMFDRDMCYLYANPAWKESYQLGDTNLIGQSHYDIFSEIGDDWKAIHQRCLTGHIDREEVAPFLREDGTTDWLSWEVRPWYEVDNSVGGLLMYTAVITDKIEAIQSHHEAEARYTGMIENASDAILVLQNDRIIYANRASYDLLGYPDGKLTNQLIWSHIAPEYLEILQTAFIKFSRDEAFTGRYEIQIINRQKLSIDVELTISQIQYENSPGVAIFMRDISERKLAEQVILETQTRLQIQAESLLTINQIADSLHQALGISELANIAVDVCSRYLGAELSAFYIADYDKQVFNRIALNSPPDIRESVSQILPFDNSLTGKIIDEKKIIISEQIANDTRLHAPTLKMLLEAGFVQLIVIPALHNDSVLGTLNILFREPKLITDETFTTLQSIGQTLGLALSNTQTVELLFQEVYERQVIGYKLRMSQERLNSVITTIPVILFAVDEKGVFTLSEGRGLELIGLETGQLVGQSIYEIYPDEPKIHQAVEEAIAGTEGHLQIKIHDIIFDLYYSPLQGSKGATGVFIDVSERTRASRLQNSLFNISQATLEAESLTTLWSVIQRELSQLMDASNFYVALYDPQTELYSFPFWQDEFELAEVLWQPHNLHNSLTDHVRETGQALIINDAEHERMYEQGLVRYQEPFSQIWLGVPLKTSNRIIGVMVVQSYKSDNAYTTSDLDVMRYIGENISWVIESKESEEALRISEERFSKAFYNSPDSLTLTKASTGELLDVNEGFLGIFSYTREESIGKTFHELGIYAIPADRERFINHLQKHGVVRNMEILTRAKSGEERICLVSAEMITLHGEDCIVSIARDVTENKEAERALQSSEETARDFQEKLQALHEITFELTKIDNLDDIYHRAVESGRDLLGYERIALFLADVKSDIIRGTYGTDMSGNIRDERETIIKVSDNSKLAVLVQGNWETYIFTDVELYDYWQDVGQGWNGVTTLWDGSQNIGAIVVDNLIHKKPPRLFERELLRLFGAVVGYVISAKKHNIARQQMVEQLQLLNGIDQAILEAVSPKAIAKAVVSPLKELIGTDYVSIIRLNEDKQEYEVLAWTKDEQPRASSPFSDAIDIMTNPDLRQGQPYVVKNLMEAVSLSKAEERMVSWGLHSYITLPLLADNELVGGLTVASNEIEGVTPEILAIMYGIVTQLALAFRQALLLEQVQAYANDLEGLVEERTAQLTAKAEELEAFTYSVSHDLRAPLRAISGFAEVVLEEFDEEFDEDAAYYLQRITYNANRLGTLIDDLLRLSHIGQRELETKTIQPENTIRAIIEELASDDQIGETMISIDALPDCKADPILLKQLWVNLITNAIKYSRTREKPLIYIGAETQNGEKVYLIRDNGIGFDMKTADKLFGVFQRLHNASQYEGTGVGLATVARIVALHQGRVWAESKVDEGATFYFTISN